jgi:hypothetical protein
MDVMCCADIGHIFSLVIDVNDKEIVSDTSTKTYVDAMVPVPDRWAQTSLLNSCFKQISVKNAAVMPLSPPFVLILLYHLGYS